MVNLGLSILRSTLSGTECGYLAMIWMKRWLWSRHMEVEELTLHTTSSDKL